jgi:Fe-S-cluster containining protein
MSLPTCCLDLDVALEHLIFPGHMDRDGLEFYRAHGLGSMTLAEIQTHSFNLGLVKDVAMVKIWHRCQHLTDQGLCDIYDRRPKICREFDCARRTDCACKRTGLTPAAAAALAETAAAASTPEAPRP